MNRTIFIAINIPPDIKAKIRERLSRDIEKSADLYRDARMMPEENWHITLTFLGSRDETLLPLIERAMRDAMRGKTRPETAMQTLTTAPPHRPPKMVWLTTTAETNGRLEAIKDAIEQSLSAQGIIPEGNPHGAYRGHITLARLPEGRRIADRVVSFGDVLAFAAATIDLMESRPGHDGTTYRVIGSIDFDPSF